MYRSVNLASAGDYLSMVRVLSRRGTSEIYTCFGGRLQIAFARSEAVLSVVSCPGKGVLINDILVSRTKPTLRLLTRL